MKSFSQHKILNIVLSFLFLFNSIIINNNLSHAATGKETIVPVVRINSPKDGDEITEDSFIVEVGFSARERKNGTEGELRGNVKKIVLKLNDGVISTYYNTPNIKE